jgi:hypothetical protein
MQLFNFCIRIEGIAIVGLLFLTTCLTAAVSFTILNLHAFLAKSYPIEADVLVVEGWLPDYALVSAADEFKNGSYQKIITISGSLSRGSYLSQYQTFAELAAATLVAIGVDPDRIFIVAEPSQSQDRTSSSAAILDRWLSTSQLQIAAINLFTLGPHARRSWLLFKEILEPRISVGIVSA